MDLALNMAKFSNHPFRLSVAETSQVLGTHLENGLTSAQVADLQNRYPRNELHAGHGVPAYSILAKQLLNAMILVLIFAMGLSFGIQDHIEGGVLASVIVLNVTIGFWQEYRAEKRMDALRSLSSPSAMVLRDGKTTVIPNPEVVPGDIVLVKMGDTIPADMRIFEAMNLACEESQLTGESIPVEKSEEYDADSYSTDSTSQDKVALADRVNMAYATTTVQKGRGRGIVTHTGMATEVGKIASSTTTRARKPGRSLSYRKYGMRQPFIGITKRMYDAIGGFLGLTKGTPLQRRLSALAYVLFFCAILLAIIVFAVNKFNLTNEVIIYAVSIGIAIIPESLVAVLTITMVVAVTVMRKANVVVRDLSALEALGGITDICSDKTGTLTEGAMMVRQVWLPGDHVYMVHDSHNPADPTKGRVTYTKGNEVDRKDSNQENGPDRGRGLSTVRFDLPNSEQTAPGRHQEDLVQMTGPLRSFILSSALCNLASVRFDETEVTWKTTGEPTEIALQVFSYRFGHNKKTLEQNGWRQLAEFPFDSSIKRMSVIYQVPMDMQHLLSPGADNTTVVFTKGAVERVLRLCTHVGIGEAREDATDEVKESVLRQMSKLASQGQRVLAVAYKPWGSSDGFWKPDSATLRPDAELRNEVEQDLTLLGLAGIYDPPRRETKMSIAECCSAGIKVHMLTGDHPETAKAIAKEVGIIPKNLGILPDHIADSVVKKATDFDMMSDEEIDALEELPLVIARCAPDTKTRMIEALRRRGAFMAMTGDGVNDAPSLSRADVGIAMGSGSDVAKSAAKIVLTDDKFDSIVSAIREGRRMFDNVQKFVLHLLTSNIGEIILLISGLGFIDSEGVSVFPISPLHVIWINMATSSFPAFGLGREEVSQDVMRRRPQDKRRGVFTNQVIVDMTVYGIVMGICSLVTFIIIVYGVNGANLGHACNESYSDSCDAVFRARAATFSLLTLLILISAWEFKSLNRSMFRLQPLDERRFPFFEDIYDNKFLFWSVVIGSLSIVPIVYIPYLNTTFFKHKGISWEWALVSGFVIVFIACVEVWKLTKRHLKLFESPAVVHGDWDQGGEIKHGDAGAGAGTTARRRREVSMSSFKTWPSFSRSSDIEGSDKIGTGPCGPEGSGSANVDADPGDVESS